METKRVCNVLLNILNQCILFAQILFFENNSYVSLKNTTKPQSSDTVVSIRSDDMATKTTLCKMSLTLIPDTRNLGVR